MSGERNPNKVQKVNEQMEIERTPTSSDSNREKFLELLNNGTIKNHIVGAKSQNTDAAPSPIEISENSAIYFPSTNKIACGICFSVFDSIGGEKPARESAKKHFDKCSNLDGKTDCLVCRVKLTPETAPDHFLSKGHTDKRKLIAAKVELADKHAFYYTHKGIGQSRPIDGSPYKSFTWTQREQTLDALKQTGREKSAIYEYKITRSIAACKDARVAKLTYASDVVLLLDILGLNATIGVLPCHKCVKDPEYEVSAILLALEQTMPEAQRANYFKTTENPKARCQSCNESLYRFNDPKLVLAVCTQLKNMILTATIPKDKQ